MSDVRNRFPRIVVGILIPAVVFALLTSSTIGLGVELYPIPEGMGTLPGFVGGILAAWLVGGIPCLLYSIIMEFFVNPQIKNSKLAMGISGLMIGVGTAVLTPSDWPILILLYGFITGCFVGYWLVDMYKHYA